MNETVDARQEQAAPASRLALLRSPAVLALLALCIAAVGLLAFARAGGGVEALAGRLGPQSLFVAVPVLALVSATPFPSEFLVIPCAGILGFHTGAWMTWLAWLGASFIQYFLARRASRDLSAAGIEPRLPGWLRRFPVSHPAFLICGRWLPFCPHIVNTAAGFGGVALGRYAFCAAVGVTPQALFISAVGNAIL